MPSRSRRRRKGSCCSGWCEDARRLLLIILGAACCCTVLLIGHLLPWRGRRVFGSLVASAPSSGTVSSAGQAVPEAAPGRPCNSAGQLSGPLARTLIVVERDSYGHTALDHILKQVEAIEQTWGSRVPNLAYMIRADDLYMRTNRTSAAEFLHSKGFPKNLTQGGVDPPHSITMLGASGLSYWEREAYWWQAVYTEAKRRSLTVQLEWVYIVNLQTYIIAENLCGLLSQLGYMTNKPVLVGRPMLISGHTYPSAFSSAGMLFTWFAFSLYGRSTDNFNKFRQGNGPPSANFLAKAGIYVRDSRDELGRERFHSFTVLGATYAKPDPWAYSYEGWFAKYSFYGYKVGLECCAATSISFHYQDPPEFRTLHYALGRAARLRAQRGSEAELAEEVFGAGWGARPAEDEYSYAWRDPRFSPSRAGRRYNNSLVRELIANRLRFGEDATWDVSRILAEPVWTRPGWFEQFPRQ